MKPLLIALFCFVCLPGFSIAQSDNEDIAIVQSIFGKTKKAIISENIQIGESQKKAFWELYDQYEEKNNSISSAWFGLLKQYADNYATLNDANAEKLADGLFSNTEKYNNLYKEYFRKFKRIVGGLKAAALFQIEIYVQTEIQASVRRSIPIIAELQRVQR